MKQFFAVCLAVAVGGMLAYFLLGGYINKHFKGRALDILIVVALMVAILAFVAACVKIADHYIGFIPK